MRQVPEETSGCAREGMRQKPDEPGEAEEDGQEEMRVTTAGENRLTVYGSKSVLFAALLLSGCTQEETTANSRGDLQVRTSRQFLLPPWSLRQKIALTCRILAAEGHESALTGQITARFTQRNVEMLRKRGLPVTPGTLYLAHFAGGARAVAILSAMENADAALVMATADATGRTKREKIIKANPFLERFTVADLRNWAERKMQVPGL
jgi:hypothetical protein